MLDTKTAGTKRAVQSERLVGFPRLTPGSAAAILTLRHHDRRRKF
jgi:hypothetical protein